MAYYAHSFGDEPTGPKWQLLKDHLRNVATLAKGFAEKARPGDKGFAEAAYTAGLLHDLGKYRPEFQLMIRGLRAKGESTRHKQAGAAHVSVRKRWDIAFAIAGHHGGLYDKAGLQDLIAGPGGRDVAEQVWDVAKKDCPELPLEIPPLAATMNAFGFDVYVRQLFSCIVDADWLDTSAHHRKGQELPAIPTPPNLLPKERLPRALAYIAKRASKCKDARIAAIRAEVLKASLDAAESSSGPGIFSMTVPTGGGKTLSSFAFALAHASKHGLRRIVYVAPYLSIIEQNARTIREAVGANDESGVVLEHHSLAESDSGNKDESPGSDRLAENWDAPIVLTTSVQFYESLFGNTPAKCRKLHNLAGSVVILDECQTLPPGLITPSAQMLESFSTYARCTIVLCTATQPAWNRDEKLLPEGLSHVREIAPPSLKLFDRLRRVNVAWPKSDDAPWSWQAIAERMQDHDQALCVVNTKKAARAVYAALRNAGCANVMHLSTAMCAAHRLEVLDHVRKLLVDHQPCHLVSTQLIEAGVDVDFPLLLREMGPLESIVQAAGRCNREGLLNGLDGTAGGKVIVFKSIDGKLPPDAWYRNGIAKVEQDFLGMQREPDLSSPEHLREYFRRLYHAGSLDKHDIQNHRKRFEFATVAEKYQLIEESTTAVVVTQWKRATGVVTDLLQSLGRRPTREVYRELGRYQVNLFAQDVMEWRMVIDSETYPGVNVCDAPYDDRLGFGGHISVGWTVQ